MTINNISERNYRGKCLGWPVTSYGGGRVIFTVHSEAGAFADMQIKLPDSFLTHSVSNHFLLHHQSSTVNYVLLLIEFNEHSAVNIFDQRRSQQLYKDQFFFSASI